MQNSASLALASAQPPQSQPAASQPTAIDDSFNLGQPGVYAALSSVKQRGIDAGAAELAESIADWSALLERPDDYRGRLVRVTGVVGRNTSWRLLTPPHDELGVIGELQLRAADQPIACKLLLTGGATDIPLGATVTFIGHFAMIQRYYGTTGKEQRAAVLVGVGPSEIVTSSPPRPDETKQGAGPVGWVAVAAGGLLLAWILLRSRLRGPLPERSTLTARTPAPLSVADDFAAWSGGHEPRRRDPSPERSDRADESRHD